MTSFLRNFASRAGYLRENVRRLFEPPNDLPSPQKTQPVSSSGPAVESDPVVLGGARQVSKVDFRATYSSHVKNLKGGPLSHDAAMKQAIGGEFEAIGTMQRELLISEGLQPSGYLIDVGCGSGRLAVQLSSYLSGRYLGIDIMSELVEHAQRISNRPDWRFEIAEGLRIPEEKGVADMVCFFSVFTHLLHEESFLYLAEAARVLKPGGRVVFSFLEFAIPSHWAVFDASIKGIGTNLHLNQFMSRDGIDAWAAALGLEVSKVFDGDKPHIPLSKPIAMEDGRIMTEKGNLGQSVCVLTKR